MNGATKCKLLRLGLDQIPTQDLHRLLRELDTHPERLLLDGGIFNLFEKEPRY